MSLGIIEHGSRRSLHVSHGKHRSLTLQMSHYHSLRMLLLELHDGFHGELLMNMAAAVPEKHLTT